MKAFATTAALAIAAQASHLDNINGIFDKFEWKTAKYMTQTNCSLDKYPHVSIKN